MWATLKTCRFRAHREMKRMPTQVPRTTAYSLFWSSRFSTLSTVSPPPTSMALACQGLRGRWTRRVERRVGLMMVLLP